jgi:hypothetical protein
MTSAVTMAPAAGAARNTPKPSGPVRNVAREDRQQRRRIAEHHRKQIEEYGAEQDFATGQEGETGE